MRGAWGSKGSGVGEPDCLAGVCSGDETVWSLSQSTCPATELWSSTELPACSDGALEPGWCSKIC